MFLSQDTSHTNWWPVLTDFEREQHGEYSAKWESRTGKKAEEDPEAVACLDATCADHPAWTTEGGCLPCFRTGSTKIMWNFSLRRWMTAREKFGNRGLIIYRLCRSFGDSVNNINIMMVYMRRELIGFAKISEDLTGLGILGDSGCAATDSITICR